MAAIQRFQRTLRHTLKVRLAAKPLLSNWRLLLDHLRTDMAYRRTEQFRVLHLNARNMLLRDEVMWNGTVDEACVHVQEVVHRALDLGSTALILVHNHPSGDPTPSHADIQITRAITKAASPLGIAIHDHLVIGTQGHVSLRSKGLMP